MGEDDENNIEGNGKGINFGMSIVVAIFQTCYWTVFSIVVAIVTNTFNFYSWIVQIELDQVPESIVNHFC